MQMLDKKTYKLLKKLYKVQKMEEHELFMFVGHADANKLEHHSRQLLQQGMIKIYDVNYINDGAGGHIGATRIYEISLSGMAYIESQKELLHNKLVENIRYIITTVIAVLALVLAAISLANQLGLIKLPVP